MKESVAHMRTSDMAGLIGLVVLALVIRVVAAMLGGLSLDNDERAYIAVARSLAVDFHFGRDGVPETHVSPLFPLLHAALIVAGMPEVPAGRCAGAVVSSSVVAIVWLLLAHIGERRTAWIGGTAAAIWPVLVANAMKIQPEALMALVLTAASLAWFRGSIRTAGLLLGLSTWIRPEGILVFGGFVVAEMLVPTKTRRRSITATALGGTFVVAIIAWASFQTGTFALSGKDVWVYANGVAQHRLRGAPVPRETLDEIIEEVRTPLAHILRRPAEFASGYLYRFERLTNHMTRAVSAGGLALAALGLVLLVRRDPRRACSIALPLVVVIAVIPVGMALRRHVLPMVPLLVALATDASVRSGAFVWSHLRRASRETRSYRDGEDSSR